MNRGKNELLIIGRRANVGAARRSSLAAASHPSSTWCPPCGPGTCPWTCSTCRGTRGGSRRRSCGWSCCLRVVERGSQRPRPGNGGKGRTVRLPGGDALGGARAVAAVAQLLPLLATLGDALLDNLLGGRFASVARGVRCMPRRVRTHLPVSFLNLQPSLEALQAFTLPLKFSQHRPLGFFPL